MKRPGKLRNGVGRVTLLIEGGGTGGKKLRGNPQTGDADAPTTLPELARSLEA